VQLFFKTKINFNLLLGIPTESKNYIIAVIDETVTLIPLTEKKLKYFISFSLLCFYGKFKGMKYPQKYYKF
jgi:hypothetical protein